MNSKDYPKLFWTPSLSLEQTPILFGKGKRGEKEKLSKDYRGRGVYKRHREYEVSCS
jgi:hypothetical protein